MKHLIFAIALLMFWGGAASSAAEAPALPSRIVTLSGSVTEITYALGAGDRVVAVDVTSVHPAETATLPKVGYYRALSAEGILSLRPDLVIGSADAGPPAALNQLRTTRTPLFLLPVEHSVDGARSKILAIARLLNRDKAGQDLVNALDRDLASARALVGSSKSTPRVLFIYARGQGTLSVSGRNTAADAMIALAGGVNAVTGYEGYKPLTPEALAAARPDVLLLTTTGLEGIGGQVALLEQPGIMLTPAGKARRIVTMNDDLLLGFGPRLGRGALELAGLLHPHTAKGNE